MSQRSHPARLCKKHTGPFPLIGGGKVGGPITQGCYKCNSQLLKSIYPPLFFLDQATDATVPWVCNPPPLPRDQSLPLSGLCTAPPPPSRAARSHHHRRHRHQQHGVAQATGPPPLKGRWPLLKGPSRARPAGARRPGSRRAAPSLGRAPRGVQARGRAAATGCSIFIQATLKGARRARCIVGAPRPVFGRRRRAQSEPVSGGPGEGGRDSRLKGEYRAAGPARPLQIPLRAARDGRGAVHRGPSRALPGEGPSPGFGGAALKRSAARAAASSAVAAAARGAGKGGRSGGGGRRRPRRG